MTPETKANIVRNLRALYERAYGEKTNLPDAKIFVAWDTCHSEGDAEILAYMKEMGDNA